MELSRVIEEQQQQVDKLNKEKEDARKNLNSIRNDIAYISILLYNILDQKKQILKKQKQNTWNW